MADITIFDPKAEWTVDAEQFASKSRNTPFNGATYVGAASELYTGPDYTSEGPVLYAMSRLGAFPLDDRMDYGRFSVQAQNRAASPQEHLAVSAYWLDEFERRVDEWKMALPSARY